MPSVDVTPLPEDYGSTTVALPPNRREEKRREENTLSTISWLGIYDGKGTGELSAYHRLITRGTGVEGKTYGWATEIRPVEEA